MSTKDQIKQHLKQTDVLTRFIYINGGLFLVAILIEIIDFLFQQEGLLIGVVHKNLSLPASLSNLIWKPWTLLTHMFYHGSGFTHLAFNMISLYLGGRLFIQFLQSRKLISTYILGGLSGAFLYILSYNIFPVFAAGLPFYMALGASASTTAIIIGIASYVPNYEVRMPFIGFVKLKYLALSFVLIDLINITSSNSGGHIAHLGGALYGFLYAMQLKKGKDWSEGFYTVVNAIKKPFAKEPTLRKVYSKPTNNTTRSKPKPKQELDQILDKIGQSGYDSLTAEEKEFLFKMGKK